MPIDANLIFAEYGRRKCFRLCCRAISKRGPGRPPTSEEANAPIRRLAGENDWRARKIHAELEKLGFAVGLATVSRYLPRRAPDLGKQQRWMTFLRNDKDGITAMVFVVPTVGLRLLQRWFAIDRERRRIIHSNATAQWVVQQLRESFPDDSPPRHLIFDNVMIFSDEASKSIRSFGITPKRMAYVSPWQNGVAERVHTRLRDAPEGRAGEPRPSALAKVVGLSRIGGLHHRHAWQEAA